MKRWVLIICGLIISACLSVLLIAGENPAENIMPLRWSIGVSFLTATLAFLWPWLTRIGMDVYPTELHVLVKNLRLTAISNFALGLLLVGFSYLIFGVTFLGWDTSTANDSFASRLGQGLFLGLLMLICLGLGLYAFKNAYNLLWIRQSRLFAALFDRPDTIVWLYETKTTTKHNKLTAQYFVMTKFNDGSSYQITCGSKADVAPIVTCIQRFSPHVVVGYSAAIEAKYLENPAIFRK